MTVWTDHCGCCGAVKPKAAELTRGEIEISPSWITATFIVALKCALAEACLIAKGVAE